MTQYISRDEVMTVYRKAEQENMKQAKKAEDDERRDAEEWARGANSRAAARQKVDRVML